MRDRSGDVAPAEETLLHRFETVLPVSHVLVGSQPVLDEVQRSAGSENTSYFV